MNDAEFFVLVAGRKGESDSEVSVCAARTPAQAHDMAAADFRRKRALPSSTHVATKTLHRCSSEVDAVLFFARLAAEMDRAHTTGSDA